MRVKKALLISIILYIISYVCSCSSETKKSDLANSTINLNDTEIKTDLAKDINISPTAEGKVKIVKSGSDSSSIKLNDTEIKTDVAKDINISPTAVGKVKDVKSGMIISVDNAYISNCTRNLEKGFYTVEYSHDGAQYSYLNEIYCYDLQEKTSSLIYTTQNAFWLNEFFSTEKYLFWVEYVKENQVTIYNVNQYELSTGKVTTIATRNGEQVYELCPSVSEDYVTWYDDYINGNIDISVYNIKSQSLQTISDNSCVKFAPYERLEIVNDCITYFTTDSEKNIYTISDPKENIYNIYINQYNLLTGVNKILLLGKRKDFRNLAGCFSNERYIGWFTNNSNNRRDFYLWDMVKNELFHLNLQDIYVFTFLLQQDLFLYDSQKDVIYQYLFDNEETILHNVGESACISFKQYGDNVIYMDCHTNEGVKLVFPEL
jgi:hypothetical protein